MEAIEYIVEPARDGNPTIYVKHRGKKTPLHSTVAPAGESRLLAPHFLPAKFDVLVVLGTGLGYHLIPLEPVINRYRTIVCIDILPRVEKELAGNPITSFLAANPITFITGRDPDTAASLAVALIDLEMSRGISILEHPASVRLFPEYYGKIREQLKRHIDLSAGNLATKKRFALRYIKNILMNIRDMAPAAPVSALRGIFSGAPALIVSSGPSAESVLDMIGPRTDRFWLIAVESSLSMLHARGIAPDIVISVDPQPFVTEHRRGVGPGDALLVQAISAYPGRGTVRRAVSATSHPLAQLAENIARGAIGSIDSGTGTVAGDSLALALYAGASAVGITGFDFSFPRFMIYARGTAYQDRYSLFNQTRTSPVETQNARYIMEASGGYVVEGIHTRKSLAGYRDRLADMIGKRKAGAVYALSREGLQIPGIQPLEFDRFIHEHCRLPLQKKNILDGALAGAPRLEELAPPAAVAEALRRQGLADAILDETIGGWGEREKERFLLLAERFLR